MFSAVSAIALPPDAPQWSRVKRIVARLAAIQVRPDEWTVVIFEEAEMPRDMNVTAFALPGGRIAVSDWIATNASDDALAFAIAHEMGHIQLDHQRQTWQAIMRRTGLRPRVWTELAAHAAVALPLMRQQEYEADKFGFLLAQRAGFNASAGAKELLGHDGGDQVHPGSVDREAALGIKPQIESHHVLCDAHCIEPFKPDVSATIGH